MSKDVGQKGAQGHWQEHISLLVINNSVNARNDIARRESHAKSATYLRGRERKLLEVSLIKFEVNKSKECNVQSSTLSTL